MNLNDLPPEVGKTAPGVIGSLVSLLWLKDRWPRKIAMFLAGAAFARFGSSGVARWAGLEEGFTGFLMGLFGMAVVAGVFEWLKANNIGPVINEWLRKTLGLPPLPPKPPTE